MRAKFTVDECRHYLFTPRDLTRWVQGLLRYSGRQENLLDILAYEANRIFRDRLVDAEAEQKLESVVNSLWRSQWKHTLALSDVFYSTLAAGGMAPKAAGGRSHAEAKGDHDGGKEEAAPPGDHMTDPELVRVSLSDLKTIVTQGLVYYEREEKELNMLLFPEILSNVARVDRVLSRSGGQLLLVGRSGVGKKTVAVLISYMLRYRFHTPAITRGYGLANFFVDLKTVIQAAGIEGEKVVLYIEDRQMANGAVLETLNSLLSAGEVPGLYTHEELESLLGPLRERAMEDGTYRTVYDFFLSRVRKNLHVILSMDATNPTFLVRCESNPAIYTRCDIIWLDEWRRVSMRAIPRMIEGVRALLEAVGKPPGPSENSKSRDSKYDDDDDGKYDLMAGNKAEGKEKGGGAPGGGDDALDSYVDTVVGIHEACKEAVAASPREYMSFLQTWCRLHDEKKDSLNVDLGHLKAGLDKLQDT